jgi:hypothetical protein
VTTPREEQPPGGTPPTGPIVSTAPPRSRWHWSSVPHHLGRARTSTVVLTVLFLAVAALYLSVRPDPTRATTTTSDVGGVPAQQTTQQPTAPRTTPTTTTTTPRSTTPAPTSSTGPTGSATSQRTAATSATETTGSASSTSGGVGSAPTVPTTGSPSG